MSSTITTSVVTGGTNSHATTSAEANAVATDFIHYGVSGPISLNSGSGGSGSFCVNAQGTPAMFVDVKAGSAWITATPSGQVSQKLRAYMSADYTSYAISSNSSGSTKYDWIYLKVDPTASNNPASDASDVTSLYTSRSSSNTTDNGSPPTYGVLLAVVTVANGASSITNSNISDKRTTATFRSSPAASGVNSVDVSTAATGSAPAITAQGPDPDIDLLIKGKGTNGRSLLGSGAVLGSGGTTNTPSTTISDVASSSVTFTLKSPCYLVVTYGAELQSNGSVTTELRLNVDGTDISTGGDAVRNINNTASILNMALSRTTRVTLAAGSHTIKLRNQASLNSASVVSGPYWWGILVAQ